MFKVDSAKLDTVGGPNSNNYKANLALTMGSDSFSKAFVGTVEEAAEGTAIEIGEDLIVDIPVKWVETFGQPETLKTLIGEPFIMSFFSKKNQSWYEREFTISETDGTLVINPVLADYTAVDAALAKVPEDLSIYTDESAKAVIDAVAAVTRGLTSDKQAEVDAMAQMIEDAVAALVQKGSEEIELADGTYNATGLSRAVLSMYHFHDAQVVIKGDEAWLITTKDTDNTVKRFDGMAYGKQSEILDPSDETNHTLVEGTVTATVVPTYAEDGTLETRTFVLPVPKSVIEAGEDIYYMIKYVDGYSETHDGDWYKASGGDYYLTGYTLEYVSDSTVLPE